MTMLSKVRVFTAKSQPIFVNTAGSASKTRRLLGTVTFTQQGKGRRRPLLDSRFKFRA
jgi:hypothetical protein